MSLSKLVFFSKDVASQRVSTISISLSFYLSFFLSFSEPYVGAYVRFLKDDIFSALSSPSWADESQGLDVL